MQWGMPNVRGLAGAKRCRSIRAFRDHERDKADYMNNCGREELYKYDELTMPNYWSDDARGTGFSQPGYDGLKPPNLVESLYMTNKIEHLLRECTTHSACADSDRDLTQAKVLSVRRIENEALWLDYVRQRELLTRSRNNLSQDFKKPVDVQSNPINCELASDECFLFHGTDEEHVQSIATHGLNIRLSAETSRYGRGAYFSDESCKAHQYAGERRENGRNVFTMLFCRVAPGHVLHFKANQAAANRGFLQGMKRPAPGDPVFDQNVQGQRIKRHCYDTVDVMPDSVQQHREIIVFDSKLVYPEYVINYRCPKAADDD